MTTLESIRADLRTSADPGRAVHSRRFFKSGPGEYAEGDQFLGIVVPVQRRLAKQYWRELSLPEAEILLHSSIHEERLTALFILVLKYQKDPAQREAVYNLYLANTAYINNWDLVDSSAPYIVGPYLEGRDKSILERLAKSDLLWERRIAMLAAGYFIKKDQFEWPLRIATLLLHDPHDLIHKAVGWMLREIGKRDRAVEKTVLDKHYRTMPRTMLRYAIEHFPPEERQKYLTGKVL